MTDTMRISRRGLLGAMTAGSLAACSPQTTTESFTASRASSGGTFAHGIASGDPFTTSVILWTRITPDNPGDGPVDVTWDVAEDESFNTLISSGTFTTNAARNWTVKVEATRLQPGSPYFYRFRTGDRVSPTGRTKTLPDGATSQARFAVVSCANWQNGFFNGYDHIARQNDTFDALICLGDYLYEYPATDASEAMEAIGRVHEPRHEIITLSDYRIRHAQYRTDPSLQAATAAMPMIAIWDDHETSNDSSKDHAENHDPETEGSWEERKAAALRAYYEWMPIRDPKPDQPRAAIFRSFQYGDLLTLTAIETRLLARAESLVLDPYFDMIRQEGGRDKFYNEIIGDPDRKMLGEAQLTYVAETFAQSKQDGISWRVLANQIPMAKMQSPDLTPFVSEESIQAIEPYWGGIREFVELSAYGLPVYPDAWDGYPAERERLYAALKSRGVEDMLVLTGDAHEFWINDLTDDAGDKMGVEIGTSSISSETLGNVLGDAAPDYALLVTQKNKDVRYYTPVWHGYVDLTVTHTDSTAKLIALSTVDERNYSADVLAEFTVKPAKNSLRFTTPKGLNLKQRALFNGLG